MSFSNTSLSISACASRYLTLARLPPTFGNLPSVTSNDAVRISAKPIDGNVTLIMGLDQATRRPRYGRYYDRQDAEQLV